MEERVGERLIDWEREGFRRAQGAAEKGDSEGLAERLLIAMAPAALLRLKDVERSENSQVRSEVGLMLKMIDEILRQKKEEVKGISKEE